ncbi:importin subunit alpha-4-like isoform X3 [Primulina eburnea]|uniref:importin subunit alpha-4-like isoform X3 n=1 Tax=Primulina eburnea TaxID=1245227 RepID=UPI003C6C0D29
MSLRPGSRADVRKKNYKIGVDVEEARRRREDNLVEIRKSKREDNLLKKRREGVPNGSLPQQLFPLDPSQSPRQSRKRASSDGIWQCANTAYA